MNNQLQKDIEYQINLPKEDLYLILGEMTTDSLGVFGKSPQEVIEKGKSFIATHRERIKQKICGNKKFLAYKNSESLKDRLAIALLIAEALLPDLANIPIATVAVLIAREGLISFCQEYSVS